MVTVNRLIMAGYRDEPKPETQQASFGRFCRRLFVFEELQSRTKYRCSVTKYNLETMAAASKEGEQKKAYVDNKTVETSYASSIDGIEDPAAAVAAPI